MINDLFPEQYEGFFGGLPNSKGFISRLEFLFKDLTEKGRSHPQETEEEGRFQLYFTPPKADETSDDQLLQLAKALVEMKFNFVKDRDPDSVAQETDLVASLNYRFEKPPESAEWGVDFEDFFEDEIYGAVSVEDHWFTCLRESCYYVAASYPLARWLCQDWYQDIPTMDMEYEFWRAKGKYLITEDTVYVWRE